jgi:CHAT domain-containing protein
MKIALLEFYVTEDKTYVLIIRPEDSSAIREEIAVDYKFLEQIKDNLYLHLPKVDPRSPELFENEIEEVYGLGELLIEPLLEYIKDKDLIYIVPHQALHYLPFHAMKVTIDNQKQHLIEAFQVQYLPSASVLKYCQNNNLYRKNKNEISNPLVFGTWAENDIKKHINTIKTELNELSKLFQVEAIQGLNASKQCFIRKASQSDMIHLACHGYFVSSEDSMSSSGILLNNGKNFAVKPDKSNFLKNIHEESFCSAIEIFDLDLNCHLVTLSACETGQNKNKPGDELIGISRALLHAGAPSILLTLWPVNVKSKVKLMLSFYKNWKSNPEQGKAKALQNAQIELIRDDDFNSLYHWGAYFLIGDWL